MAPFQLHPRLEADTHRLAELDLCTLLLMNDARYPWCVLVPRRADVREVYELAAADRARLLQESCDLGAAMMRAFAGFKLNVAALGNLVPQLHLHHIVRFEHDAAWPAPVWGRHPPQPYTPTQRLAFVERLRPYLADVRWQG